MRKILITGASGLLGGRIYSQLKDKFNILPVSRFDSQSNLDLINFHKIDWNNNENLKELLKNKDIIIHSAGLNAQESNSSPLLSYEVNTINTQKLVELCSNSSNPPIFIYFSTAHVYSSNLEGIISEDSPTTNTNPYASSHKAGEDIVLHATNQGKIKGIVLRLSNSFGFPLLFKTNCWMLLVNDLVRQAILYNKMIINSSGQQYRNFFSIEFFINFLNKLLDISYDKLNYNLLNVGSESNFTIWDMALQVQSRVQNIFKSDIILSRKEIKDINKFKPFKYEINRLKEIIPGEDIFQNNEIDNLTYFCIKNFQN